MGEATNISVTLTPELGEHVRRKVDRGDYESPDALVCEAVARLLSEDEVDLREVSAAVEEAIGQSDRGQGRPAQEVFDQLRAKHGIPR